MSSTPVETVEGLAARYEAEYDARELALMLAREQVDRDAGARRNLRSANRNLLIAGGALVAGLGIFVTGVVLL